MAPDKLVNHQKRQLVRAAGRVGSPGAARFPLWISTGRTAAKISYLSRDYEKREKAKEAAGSNLEEKLLIPLISLASKYQECRHITVFLSCVPSGAKQPVESGFITALATKTDVQSSQKRRL